MEAEFSKIFFLVNPGIADGESPSQKLTRLVMIRLERVPEPFHAEQSMQHTQKMW